MTEVSKGRGEVLEVFGRRRFHPNQEKVRSTTQRRGSATKPVTSSLRLTISLCSSGTLATVVSNCRAWYRIRKAVEGGEPTFAGRFAMAGCAESTPFVRTAANHRPVVYGIVRPPIATALCGQRPAAAGKTNSLSVVEAVSPDIFGA